MRCHFKKPTSGSQSFISPRTNLSCPTKSKFEMTGSMNVRPHSLSTSGLGKGKADGSGAGPGGAVGYPAGFVLNGVPVGLISDDVTVDSKNALNADFFIF